MGEKTVKLLAHADDTLRHSLNLALPFAVQLLIAENGAGNTGTVQRRVGVHRADNNLKLTVHAQLLLSVFGGQRERADTLAVQSHVLRKGLSERDLVAL